ncbi:MAG: cobalamin B12-binding domain-containing protein [Syntrophaceticus sp.]|jgi:corrinoid protein of di/trimethylamine methyltransferase
MSKNLVDLIADLKEDEALQTTKELLDAGTDPMVILDHCREATELVGKRFEEGKYFIPDLLMSGEILEQISDIVKSNMTKDVETDYIGKIVIGTVEGDIHDIGKNIVTFMMNANGFEVIDIGVDVPPQKFVEAVKEHKPDVVGMSALLTLAFDSMKRTVDALEEAGLRDQVKIIVGGCPIDANVTKYTGADAYGKDAQEGVVIAKKWVNA